MTFKDYLNELKTHTPYDFSDYSDNSIHRRLQKILKDHNLTMDELVEKTRTDNYFVEHLVDEITVNTTELFRDPDIWIAFYEKIYPILKTKKSINIWHAGCSSGQEVYSNLILLNELGLLSKTKVYATDINNRMIRESISGTYRYKFNKGYFDDFNSALALKPIQNINHIDIEKYFTINEKDDSMQVSDFLRSIPVFKKHDLVNELVPFYNKFDLIFCRNVLIYFNTSLQSKIFQMFYNKLYSGGLLLLGNHETLTGFFKTKFSKNGPVFTKNSVFHLKY